MLRNNLAHCRHNMASNRGPISIIFNRSYLMGITSQRNATIYSSTHRFITTPNSFQIRKFILIKKKKLMKCFEFPLFITQTRQIEQHR